LTLPPILFLLWLMRRANWRRRMGQLSLLTQCVLVSLLLHGLLASVLAVWKVGTGIIDSMHRQGGGTQVILASSGAASEISTQLRAVATTVNTPEPDLSVIAAPVSEAQRETRRISIDVPSVTRISPTLLELRDTDHTPASPASIRTDLAQISPKDVAPTMPRHAAPESMQEAIAQTSFLPQAAAPVQTPLAP